MPVYLKYYIRFIVVYIKINRPSACPSLNIQNPAEHVCSFAGAFLAERVVDPLAVFSGSDQTCIQQDVHVMGERRLADIQRFLQAAGAALARMQQREDRQAVFVAHRLENARHFLVGVFHGTTL